MMCFTLIKEKKILRNNKKSLPPSFLFSSSCPPSQARVPHPARVVRRVLVARVGVLQAAHVVGHAALENNE